MEYSIKYISEQTLEMEVAQMNSSEALKKLLDGNRQYVETGLPCGDVSPEKRLKLASYGQEPYAIIISCSDSRVIPEIIFNAGIGDLFVIRVAGNVIDSHQLGSIEYAAEHLGAMLIVVLGHTGCGAVDAAINHKPEGYIKFITDEIVRATGGEKDPYKAACLNVKQSISMIESSLSIQEEEEHGLRVMGAIYDLKTGKVDFLD